MHRQIQLHSGNELTPWASLFLDQRLFICCSKALCLEGTGGTGRTANLLACIARFHASILVERVFGLGGCIIF